MPAVGTKTTKLEPPTDELASGTPSPISDAKQAGLHYVTDAGPGIRRKRAGRHFTYVAADGRTIRDPASLTRIKALAVPPAWTDVWICPSPRGHIQATGRDARGRKQYRYHAQWREQRDAVKYDRMIAFAEALPTIRERVRHDLALPGLPRDKVLATIIQLLETTLIRVGNVEYARQNGSVGLTTMRDKHVHIAGSSVAFAFQGKSGKRHTIDVRDRRLAQIVRRCRDLPGYELFQYVDDVGQRHAVTSTDVNTYLREITGQDFSAKDFRTWYGTVLAAQALQEFGAFDSGVQARHNVVQAVEAVAKRLGNTPSICRKCYVHPAVVDAYLDGDTIEVLRLRAEQELTDSLAMLPPEEAAVLAFLRERRKREPATASKAS